jgi:PPK2 family polyphosphate:nucleotide phosphotransferase
MGKIKLSDISTRAPKDLEKDSIKKKTREMVDQLDDLQNLLYAGAHHSLLIVLQGMDASGKDGVIRNIFGHLNPQGVTVRSFKKPTDEELSHDFLWRVHHYTPAKGQIQIFNRSHYEDILVTRVHQSCDDKLAKKRMNAINDFEALLQTHNNTHILKFYLHVSKEEQHERLQERLRNPSKMWKYNENDFEQTKYWDAYEEAYEDCFNNCNKPAWIIVPSDQNWYKEYVIAKHVKDMLAGLEMTYPQIKRD